MAALAKIMRTLLVVLALLATLAPLASAAPLPPCVDAPVGSVCASEYSSSFGSCASGDGIEQSQTAVTANTAAGNAIVYGQSDCYAFGPSHGETNTVFASASTPAGPITIIWSDVSFGDPKFGETSFCFIGVYGLPQDVYQDCTGVDQPNPGWGNILP